MRSIYTGLLAAAIGISAITLVTGTPAQADDGPVKGVSAVDKAVPPAPGSRPRASLKISVAVGTATAKTVKLTCNRDGGTHPTPRPACRLLRAVKGNPAKLGDGGDAICTREYNPQTATVRGKWRGKRVDFTRTYANPCMMKAAGGPLFTF